MKLGAQLYTVRNYTSTLEGFAQALKKIADIGYTTVQVSGTCDFDADWLSENLSANGLRCVLTHTNPKALLQDTSGVIKAHKTFDCPYIGVGSMPDGVVSGYDDFVKNFAPVAKAIAESGLYFMYHNHASEFIRNKDGNNYLERLALDFSPVNLGFTLDTYWIQAAGGDPAFWIRKLGGRVPCVHLKDMSYVSSGVRMAPVGEGNMNFDSVLAACEKAGTKHLLVEQDDCYLQDPFECLRKSYQNLVSHGLS